MRWLGIQKEYKSVKFSLKFFLPLKYLLREKQQIWPLWGGANFELYLRHSLPLSCTYRALHRFGQAKMCNGGSVLGLSLFLLLPQLPLKKNGKHCNEIQMTHLESATLEGVDKDIVKQMLCKSSTISIVCR